MPPLLLLLIASFLELLALASSANSTKPRCSPTSSCGNLTISYPFWLEQPSQPLCGSPSFQLKCNTSGAFLKRSILESYRVVSIFTENNSFHVVDENLPLATGCPAPQFNISLGIWQAPFVISRANARLHFLSCNQSLPVAPPGFHNQSCDNKSSFVRLAEEGELAGHSIPPGCNFTVVPILERPNGSQDGYVASMRSGFLLDWAGASDDCPKCVASRGQCAYGDGLRFACNCTDGLHPEKCGEFVKSKHHGKLTQSIRIKQSFLNIATQTLLTDQCIQSAHPVDSFFKMNEASFRHIRISRSPPGCNFTVMPILERPNESRDVAMLVFSRRLELAGESDDCPNCIARGGQCTYGDGLQFACNCSDVMDLGSSWCAELLINLQGRWAGELLSRG